MGGRMLLYGHALQDGAFRVVHREEQGCRKQAVGRCEGSEESKGSKLWRAQLELTRENLALSRHPTETAEAACRRPQPTLEDGR